MMEEPNPFSQPAHRQAQRTGIDRRSSELLGFSRLLDLIRERTQTALGSEAVGRLYPSFDSLWLEKRLALAEESQRFTEDPGRIGLNHLDDPRPILEKLRLAGVLQPSECLSLLDFLKVGKQMATALRDDE